MSEFTFESKNESVATITGNTVTGLAVGTTYLSVKDKNGNNRGTIECVVSQKSSQDVEPTGITVSPKYVPLAYLGNNTKFLTATVTPNTVKDKRVVWESSDPSVAWVSSSGKVIAENKTGDVIITAKSASNEDIFDTCKVTVTAQGTFITAITPQSISAIPAKGAVQEFTVTKRLMGGEDSGFGVYGGSTGFTTYKGGKSSTEVNSFTQAFPVNWGNEQTIEMQVRGNFTNDPGKTIKIQQQACPVMKRLIVSSKSFPASEGENVQMWYPLDFEAALGSVSGGKINVSTAKSIVTSANSNITDSRSSGGNPVDWVRLDTASVGVYYLPGDSGNKNLDEYKSKGTINGSVPQGKTAVYMCTLECDDNNTGQARTAYIHFPTYVYNSSDHTYSDGYAVFTVTQSA